MNTIEVFKTDINEKSEANSIVDEIRRNLPGSDPSIDTEDCDNVLRIESPAPAIDESKVERILSSHGYEMEVLP